MGSINGQKAAGAAAVLWVILQLGSGFVVQPPPAAHESATKFLEFYDDNRNALLLQGVLVLFANIPALVFAGGFWHLLRREEGEGGIFAPASVLAFIFAGAIATVGSAWSMGIAALGDGNGLTEESARTLGVVSTLVTPAVFSGIVPAVALSGYVLWNGKSLPSWVGIIGLVAAIPGLVAICGVANSGAFQPFGIFSFGSFLLSSLYILLIGVFMWLRAAKA